MTDAPGTIREEADVVVIGAGHNGLVAASYLAAAGLEVLVLEARDIAGGNTITEELTLPGFAHDSCSSAHVLIQSNPLMRDDELGLLSSYGLEYIRTDPAAAMPLTADDSFVMPLGVEAAVEEIARYDAEDAKAFEQVATEWQDLRVMHGRFGSGLSLGDSAVARRYQELKAKSGWDVVHETYRNPLVRDFMLWMAMATIQDVRRPGTGVLPASLAMGRAEFGWTTPVGGSGALPDALIRQLRAHGGDVVLSAQAQRVEVENGRATAVHTADGRRFAARVGVVSAAHVVALSDMIAADQLPSDLVRARETWRPGLSVFAVHAALTNDLTYPSKTGGFPSVAGAFGTTEGVQRHLTRFWRGELETEDPWLLVVDQTVVDQTRAPDAGGATFKILTIAPWDLADGRDWAAVKQEYGERVLDLVRQRVGGLSEEDILAVRYESPRDVAAHNIHNLGGSCHGGEFHTADGTIVPGVTDYRTGIEGLYLTGATTHPGGSVSGRPGRNTARAFLTALGKNPADVMGDA